jgi:hypothetical protein
MTGQTTDRKIRRGGFGNRQKYSSKTFGTLAKPLYEIANSFKLQFSQPANIRKKFILKKDLALKQILLRHSGFRMTEHKSRLSCNH